MNNKYWLILGLFSVLLFSTVTFASETYTKKKFYLSSTPTYLSTLFEFESRMGKHEREWFIDFSFIDGPSPAEDITLETSKEYLLKCLQLTGGGYKNCLNEYLSLYHPDLLDYNFSDISRDLRLLYAHGLPVRKKTNGVEEIELKSFNENKLSGTFKISLKSWKDGEEVELGYASEVYTSGTVTIEYVPELSAPIQYARLNETGALAVDTTYSLGIMAVASNPDCPFDVKWDRRCANYTRSWFTCVNLTTNSSHKALLSIWEKVDDADQYYYHFDADPSFADCENDGSGDDRGTWYYSYQGNATPGQNYSAHGAYFWENATHVFMIKNNTGEGNWRDWDNGMLSDQDTGFPMYRCWGSGVSLVDFYDADVAMSWDHWANPQKNMHDVNASLQIGSIYGYCDMASGTNNGENDIHLSVVENLIVYGEDTSLVMGDYYGSGRFKDTYYGWNVFISMFHGSGGYGQYGGIWVDDLVDGWFNIYDSRISMNDTAYCRFYINGSVAIRYSKIDNLEIYPLDNADLEVDYLENTIGGILAIERTSVIDLVGYEAIRPAYYGIATTSYNSEPCTLGYTELEISDFYHETIARCDIYAVGCTKINITDSPPLTRFCNYYWDNNVQEYKNIDFNITNSTSGLGVSGVLINITSTPERYQCERSIILNNASRYGCVFVEYLPQESQTATTDANGNVRLKFQYSHMGNCLNKLNNCYYDFNLTLYRNSNITISESNYQTIFYTDKNITEYGDWPESMQITTVSGNGAGPATETVYCAWYKEIYIGERKYILCIDQDAQVKIFWLANLGFFGLPIPYIIKKYYKKQKRKKE